MRAIEMRGVNTNNLKNIDVDIPIGKISVVTGRSGSGKSSLVFDSLYGESYRRYVESLSSFARQYLKALPKPEISEVRNLPPAVAIKQNTSSANARSTVATLTEMGELLKTVFTHLGIMHCPNDHGPVKKDVPDAVADAVLDSEPEAQVMVLASLQRYRRLPGSQLKEFLTSSGFVRLLHEGKVVRIEDAKVKMLRSGQLILDRVKATKSNRGRLKQAVEIGFRIGDGACFIEGEKGQIKFSNRFACNTCDLILREPTTAMFSYNHPYGACEQCEGFGRVGVLNESKALPKRTLSIDDQGIPLIHFGGTESSYRWLRTKARNRGIDTRKAFSDYTKDEWDWLWNGDDDFEGLHGYYRWLESKRYKQHYRIHAARYRAYETCPKCKGSRFHEDTLQCRVEGKSIADVMDMTVDEAHLWFQSAQEAFVLSLSPTEREKVPFGLAEAFEEGLSRLSYLQRIGVGYLNLSRTSRTLSGGELQRVQMARCLGSTLTGTLFCLDEPTAGLHARDSMRLFSVINDLKAQENTVVIVEHEAQIISRSDHVIEIGPEAGHAGGFVTRVGRPSSSNTLRIEPPVFAPPKNGYIRLRGARTNNLKDVDLSVPLGMMTGVCGVSGSGKTSLVQNTFYPLLAEALGQGLPDGDTKPLASSIGPATSLKKLAGVELVSQSGIGRSSRSNIATYLGVMDFIRKGFAGTDEAKRAGLNPGAFSFNVPGGRCETCKGLGTVVEDLSFLGELPVTCPECEGDRFKDSVLRVKFRGKNLIEMLGLTVDEARTIFFDEPKVCKILDRVRQLGLGYVTLGQATSSFSGGEAQRLKLLDITSKARDEHFVLIFDEPTTGLSDADVDTLATQLRSLCEQGHTLIVVEHHVRLLSCCDYLVEVGPEAGDEGGTIVYQGPATGLADLRNSATAPFLFPKD